MSNDLDGTRTYFLRLASGALPAGVCHDGPAVDVAGMALAMSGKTRKAVGDRRTRPDPGGLSAWVTGADLAALAGLPMLIPLSAGLPVRLWHPVSALAVPFAGRINGVPRAELERRLALAIGGRSAAATPSQIVRSIVVHTIGRHLMTIRAMLPMGGETFATRLVGGRHIDVALSRGKGAVIWDSQFQYAGVATKMALFRAGHAAVHMSSAAHGVSGSRFATAVLNRPWVAAEERYLAARVVVSYAHPRAALARLGAALTDNRVVSVSVRDFARRPLVAPFLERTLRLGPGAVALALKHGAPVLPAFTAMTRPGQFLTVVDTPLTVPAGVDERAAMAAMATDYARRLEAHVLAAPGQWAGWFSGPTSVPLRRAE